MRHPVAFARRRSVLAILPLCAWIGVPALAAPPSLVEELVGTAGFPRVEVEKSGEAPLARELHVADPSREAAWAGLVRLRTDGAALGDALACSGGGAPPAKGVRARGCLHDPVRPEDVAGIEFSGAELEELADCNVAACKFKVGRAGLESLAAIDWSRPDAGDEFTRRFRSEVSAYVDAYRQKGDAALVVYADKSTPASLGATVAALVPKFAAFQRQAPELTRYLLAYPAGRRPRTSDAIVWQIADFGYRPTLVVDHLVVDRDTTVPGATLLAAAKTIYANHYLAGRVQMGAALDGPTALGVPGHFLVLVDRIAFDDALTGFKRKLLQKGLRDSLVARLAYLRDLAEGAR